MTLSTSFVLHMGTDRKQNKIRNLKNGRDGGWDLIQEKCYVGGNIIGEGRVVECECDRNKRVWGGSDQREPQMPNTPNLSHNPND